MTDKPKNIIIAESSEIILTGISHILANAGKNVTVHRASNICDLEPLYVRTKAELVIINSQLIQNQLKYFQSLKNELLNLRWIGIVYTYADPEILSTFDEIININDYPGKIIGSVEKLLKSDYKTDNPHKPQENLSERETDVLKLLVAGNANKEIADKLNISIHTVISHRKNISQKTGIKSLSGLTIYAVVNKIISVDSYRE